MSATPTTAEGRILGKRLDAMDELTRLRAVELCLAAIQQAKNEAGQRVELKGQAKGRRHPGTGIGDTAPETWAAMRAALEQNPGETLVDVARRFGVIYSAARTVAMRERWPGWSLLGDVDQVEEARRAAYKAKAAYDRAQGRRHRTVRPEADGLAAVIELLPRRRRAEEPLIVPEPPGRSC